MNDFFKAKGGIVFLMIFSMVCFCTCFIFLVLLKQFAGMDLFFYYNGFSIGAILLSAILITSYL